MLAGRPPVRKHGEADEMIQHTKNAPKLMAWVRFCFPFIEWAPLLSVA